MKVKEFISTIRNELNSTHLDDYISGEYIFSRGMAVVEMFLKREADSRRIFNNSSSWITLECLELEDDANCCMGLDLSSAKVTKKKLPQLFSTGYGELIKVLTLDKKSQELKRITVGDYKNVSKKRYTTKGLYYWLDNDRIVVPDSDIEAVTAVILPNSLNSTLLENSNICSFLDLDFPAPSYLLDGIIDKTKESLINIKKIIIDEDSNLNSNDKA